MFVEQFCNFRKSTKSPTYNTVMYCTYLISPDIIIQFCNIQYVAVPSCWKHYIESILIADFTNYVYSAVYFNSNGTYTINGISVTGVAGSTLDILVGSDGTTLNAGFLLLGNSKPLGVFDTGLFSSTTTNEFYKFVDIKTGNPIIE